MVNDKVQASIRVCELLEKLKSNWGMWEENQKFYIHQLLPQLQHDMTRCVIDAERRILQELKRIASAEEWENLPYILTTLPEQRTRAWRIDQMERMLAKYHFNEAAYLYERLKPYYSAQRYHALCQQYQELKFATEVIEKVKLLLANYHFEEADILYQQVKINYSQEEYDKLKKQFELKYKHITFKEHLAQLLEAYRFFDADQYFTANPVIPEKEYLDTKAEYIRRYFDLTFGTKINDEQSRSLAIDASSILVKARAGSGKTRVLVCKVEMLLQKAISNPDHIMVLAFNPNAASNIAQRLRTWFGVANFKTARTFHSLAYQLVQPQESLLGNERRQISVVQQAMLSVWNEEFASKVYQFFRCELEDKSSPEKQLTTAEYYRYRRDFPQLTLRGEIVKSSGEKLIADFLYEHGIRYEYERSHRWDGNSYRPDFTFWHNDTFSIIEYWGIDLNDREAITPDHWKTNALEYKKQAEEKRAYWKRRKKILIETSIVDLRGGREQFERCLKAKLKVQGITCNRLPDDELQAGVKRNHQDQLCRLFLSFIQRAKQQRLNPQEITVKVQQASKGDERSIVFWELASKVYQAYELQLRQGHHLDFDDLLIRAADLLEASSGNCTVLLDRNRQHTVTMNKLKWLLIDEFQDFSPAFFHLVSVLRKYNQELKLFCVGDDWQAINSFAGSDLIYFHQFAQHFIDTKEVELLTNQRSKANIVRRANYFMANMGTPATTHPALDGGQVFKRSIDQLPFEIERSAENLDGDIDDRRFIFSSLKFDNNFMAARSLKQCYQIITQTESKDKSIAILSRTNRIYRVALEEFRQALFALVGKKCARQIDVSTIHRYKGLEADIVILAEIVDGVFPSVHRNNLLFSIFARADEDVLEKAYLEEKRLFYVALTRAKESLWILTETGRESPFLGLSDEI